MRIETREEGASLRVVPAGELVLATAAHLRDELLRACEAAGERRVLLDLHCVTFMDSTGHRLLVEMAQHFRGCGGGFGVVSKPELVRRLNVAGSAAQIPWANDEDVAQSPGASGGAPSPSRS